MIEVLPKIQKGYFVYYELTEGGKRTGGGLRDDYSLVLCGEAIYPQLLIRALLAKIIPLKPQKITLVGDWKLNPTPFGFVFDGKTWTAKGEDLVLASECGDH